MSTGSRTSAANNCKVSPFIFLQNLITFSIPISLFFSLFVSNPAPAQNKPLPNEMDKQYAPDKNSIFSSKGSSSVSSGSYSEIKNAVKFNPFLLTRSTFALFYERGLSDVITVQGGLGFCFGKDLIQTFTASDDIFYLTDSRSDVGLGELMYNSAFVSGLFSAASIKLYGDDVFDGSYIELGTRYNNNKLTVRGAETNPRIAGNPDIVVRNMNFHFLWGYQGFTEGTIKTTHDVYMGFGVRLASYDKFKLGLSTVNQSGYQVDEYVHTLSRENAILPVFLFGYAFGIGF